MEPAKKGRRVEAIGWRNKTITLDADTLMPTTPRPDYGPNRGYGPMANKALTQGLTAARRAGDDKASGELNDLAALLGN